ncbi:MAG: hypothetical protein HOP08_08940 [Cyclobacteriaceae bacterium]|nr:hypothetical protein [Cyclobacteriaceae bacterium]
MKTFNWKWAKSNTNAPERKEERFDFTVHSYDRYGNYDEENIVEFSKPVDSPKLRNEPSSVHQNLIVSVR